MTDLIKVYSIGPQGIPGEFRTAKTTSVLNQLTQTIGTCPAGCTVTRVSVSVTSGFPGGVTFSIGDDELPTRFALVSDFDLTQTNQSIFEAHYTYLTNTTIKAYFNVVPTSGGASFLITIQ